MIANLKRAVLLPMLVAVFFSCKKNDLKSHQSADAQTKARAVTAYPSIKVMSFNVRHNDAGDPLSLDQRKNRILTKILNSNADIVGVQEVSNNWFETWLTTKMTEAGFGNYRYPGVGSPKIIYYRTSMFNFIEGNGFQLSDNTTGSWIRLQDKSAGGTYFVLNNHWPYDSKDGRVAAANHSKLVIQTHSAGNVVIAIGDLNATPGKSEIGILKSAADLKPTHTSSQLTYHGWGSSGISKLDYIFVSPRLVIEPGTENVLDGKVDGEWPSDHWPITVRVHFE